MTLSKSLTSLDLNGSKMATVMSRSCPLIMREYFIVSLMLFQLLGEGSKIHKHSFCPTVFLLKSIKVQNFSVDCFAILLPLG